MRAAASALHNAANALNLCRPYLPRTAPEPGAGIIDMRAEVILDPVAQLICNALAAIAAEIGEDAMLTA